MAANPTTLELAVSGMTCTSCLRHVTDALLGVDGVTRVDVNLQGGRATVSYDAVSATIEQMIGVIEEAGYHASVAPGSRATGLPVWSGCGSSCCV